MHEATGTDDGERRTFAALGHPVSVAALVLWIINDHWAKARFANAVTGKLSDVAGLVLFPLIVAAALALWVRRPMGWGIAATVAIYGSVNLFGWADHTMEAVASIVAPAQLTQDPTDLVLLPVLAVPAAIWRNATSRNVRRSWAQVIFAVGIATTVATSSPDVSTERFEGTFVLDREQPAVRIPVELEDEGRVVDPAEYLQMGVDFTAFGRGGSNVGRDQSLVEVELVRAEDGAHVEYRLVDPASDAAPVEVRWSLVASADHDDDRVSAELRLDVQPPAPESVAVPLGEWAPDWTYPSEVQAARITVTTLGAAPQLGLAVVGLGELDEHGFRAATDDAIVDLSPRRVVEVGVPKVCRPAAPCTFDTWVSWQPAFTLPGRLRVYGEDVSVELTPAPYLTLGEESASADVDVRQRSRIEVPIDAGFGRDLTPPEAITAHVDVDVEALAMGSSLTRTDRGFLVCCEDGDGLYLLGSTPDSSEIVAVANYRGTGGSERLRVAVRTSLRWVPEIGSIDVDPKISIGDVRIVE